MSADDDDDDCAVSSCGQEGRLVPVCANGHRMHLECLQGLVSNNERPCCPQCRDPYLSELKALLVEHPYVHRPASPGPFPSQFHAPGPVLAHEAQLLQQMLAHQFLGPPTMPQGRPTAPAPPGVVPRGAMRAHLPGSHNVPSRVVTNARRMQSFPVPGGRINVETLRYPMASIHHRAQPRWPGPHGNNR